MDNGPQISPRQGFWRWMMRGWFALNRRRVRLLQAADIEGVGPVLLAVSHSSGFLPALALAAAMDRPVRCLVPEALIRNPVARLFARRGGFILCQISSPLSETTLREAIDVLAGGEALVVFADDVAVGHAVSSVAATAAGLLWRAEVQHVGRRVPVHPVHLFLPESSTPAREILIYVDQGMNRPEGRPLAPSREADTQAFAAALALRFQENAFQLAPADLEYFLEDAEELLRTDLNDDWSSRPEWKQDAEGFVLSRMVSEWVKQTNYLHPSRLVALRQSLDDYRRLRKLCVQRELQVAGGDSSLPSGWRLAVVWLEMLLGLPIAIYGLLNHLAVISILAIVGSFKRHNSRERSAERTIRGLVALVFYVLQIFLVAHWRGRAVAGYYAPTLPASGAYLWRYVNLLRPQARRLFISIGLPGLRRKIKRLRHSLAEELDRAFTGFETPTGTPP